MTSAHPHPRRTHHALWRHLLGAAALGLAACAAHAAELTLTINGLASADGALGCALFAEAAAARFPLDQDAATTQRVPAREGSVQCVFRGLPAGSYAAAVAHDLNGNGKTDRNLLGMPTEPWAVSNNLRPTLRAPRFAEAAISLGADERRSLVLQLAR